MKLSEITTETVREYARIEPGDGAAALDALLAAAKAYVKHYTGLADAEMDEYEDLSIAVLVLCSDLYDNRQMTVESDKVNRVVQSILDLHTVNLL